MLFAFSISPAGMDGASDDSVGDIVAEAGQLGQWQALAVGDDQPLYPLRTASVPARIFGADSETVLARC